MSELTKEDVDFVLSRLPKDVIEIMKRAPIYLGGGFIREVISGGKVQDIDVFGPSVEEVEKWAKYLETGRNAKSHWTKNATTVISHPRLPVQFIKRWVFSDPVKLLESFDFTVCQAVIWWDREWKSAASPQFYVDLAARRLVYTFPERDEEAGGSMLRVIKFVRRGYNIQVLSLAGVIARLNKGVLTDRLPENPAEKDVAVVIASLLREVDPSVIHMVGVPADDLELMMEDDLS